MLSKKHRFHGRKSVPKLMSRRPQRINTSAGYALIADTKTEINSRLCVVISKKKARQATDRNRIRRRVFASIGPIIQVRPTGLSIVYIVTKPEVLLAKTTIVETLRTELLTSTDSKGAKASDALI